MSDPPSHNIQHRVQDADYAYEPAFRKLPRLLHFRTLSRQGKGEDVGIQTVTASANCTLTKL